MLSYVDNKLSCVAHVLGVIRCIQEVQGLSERMYILRLKVLMISKHLSNLNSSKDLARAFWDLYIIQLSPLAKMKFLGNYQLF